MSMNARELRESVRSAYSAAASDPSAKHPFPVGPDFARDLGYPQELLSRIPNESVEAFAGVSAVSLQASESGFIGGIGLQIENATGKHIGRDDVKNALALVDLFSLQAEKGQAVFPLGLSFPAVRHVDLGGAIVIAFDQPF